MNQSHDRMEKEREKSQSSELAKELSIVIRPMIYASIEEAFRRYCRSHKAGSEMENLEWTRFKKFLEQYL